MRWPRKRKDSDDIPLGSPLAELSETDYAYLVGQLTEGMSSRGVSVTGVVDGMIRTDRGHAFGLDNLARRMLQSKRESWPDLIATHVNWVIDEMGGASFDISKDDLKKAILPRLFLNDGSLPFPVPSWVRHIGSGLIFVAALDLPTTVQTRVGERDLPEGWDPLWDTALENLRALPAMEVGAEKVMGTQLQVYTFHWDFFGATRLAIIDELIAAHQPDQGWGMLISVPDRSRILAHIIRDTAFPLALTWMVRETVQLYDTQPGNLSPWVYYRRDQSAPWEQICFATGDGEIEVRIPEALSGLLEAS